MKRELELPDDGDLIVDDDEREPGDPWIRLGTANLGTIAAEPDLTTE